jgi:ATP-dependent Clp protease protease subunit
VSLRRLPRVENLERPQDESDLYPGERELTEYEANIGVRLAAAPNGTVIDIFGPIGKDWLTGEGVSDKDVSLALKDATGEVTVNINSPGGSAFQGLAIYSMLSNYSGKVVVNILGAAGSAASIIAMSGDTIRISTAGSVMIHNAQAGIMGDRHDMEDGVAALTELDAAIRSIYAARTGVDDAELDRMMTPTIGTWMFGKQAIDRGFADELLGEDKLVKADSAKGKTKKNARAELDGILAKAGVSRTQRRDLYRNAFPGKVASAEPAPSARAAFELAASIREMTKELTVTPRADATTPNAGLSGALENLERMVAKL